MKTNCTLSCVAAGLLSASIISGVPLAAIALESSPLIARNIAENGSEQNSISQTSDSGEDLIASGRELYSLGQFSAAAAKWQRAADVAKSREESMVQAVALSYLSSAHQELNQWDLAQRAIDDSLKI